MRDSKAVICEACTERYDKTVNLACPKCDEPNGNSLSYEDWYAQKYGHDNSYLTGRRAPAEGRR